MGAASSKEQLIVAAIENQDTSELRTILKDLVPEQIRTICKSFVPGDENQCTILHYAAWQGERRFTSRNSIRRPSVSVDNPDLLAPFLDYADDLEVRDGLGWTPLMTAVNRGSKQNVKLLLARGAKVDCDWTKGMSLIADAMNFNDAGKLVLWPLAIVSKLFIDRTGDDSHGARRSSSSSTRHARQRSRSECILPAALCRRRWPLRNSDVVDREGQGSIGYARSGRLESAASGIGTQQQRYGPAIARERC